jgi:hypothetical protein
MQLIRSRWLAYSLALGTSFGVAAACSSDGGGGGGSHPGSTSPEAGISGAGSGSGGQGNKAGAGAGARGNALLDGGGDGAITNSPLDLSCLKVRQLRGYSVSPSAVAQLFRVETCADGTPVPHLKTANFDISEDHTNLSSEAVPEIQTSKGLRVYVSLVLDMSSSTHDELPQLIDAAKSFVDELLVVRKLTNVMIGIDLFDGSPTLNEWLLPISDPDRLKAKIGDLTNYMAADPSSTNLYGGVIDAVTKLQQRQIQVINANDNGVVTVGYAVLFTDGADTSARVSKAQAVSTLASARFVDPSSTQVQATVATYAVPLAGKDYTPGSLEELLSGTATAGVTSGACSDACKTANNGICEDNGPGASGSSCALGTDCSDCGTRSTNMGAGGSGGSSGSTCNDYCAYSKNGICQDGTVGSASALCLPGTDCTDCKKLGTADSGTGIAPAPEKVDGTRFVLEADSAASLKQRFSDVAAKISSQLDGTYLLAYCSPKRSGKHTVSVNVNDSISPNSTGYTFLLNADGFGPGCSTQYFKDVCDSRKCGGFNCGACNEETDVCTSDGQCESACIKNNACGGQTITNDFGYQQVCNADPNQKQCNGLCVDVSSDEQNCGDCGTRCASTATCTNSQCQCPQANQTSCPNGCFDLSSDSQNCGVCGNYCPTGVQCVAGKCACPTSGQTGCFGSCVDTTSNQNNCGKCGNSCPYNATCSASSCVCQDNSLTACGSQCVDTQSDAANCGKCSTTCTTTQQCSGGKCASCTDTALPALGSFSYNGTATASRKRADGCSSSADGTALAWAPPPGTYTVTLKGSGGSISGDVYASCAATGYEYCLTNGSPTTITVNANGGVIFFIRDSAGASSPFTLTATSLSKGPLPPAL